MKSKRKWLRKKKRKGKRMSQNQMEKKNGKSKYMWPVANGNQRERQQQINFLYFLFCSLNASKKFSFVQK